jgi:hypothetical protein
MVVRLDYVVCCVATTESRFVGRADEKLGTGNPRVR